MQEKIRFRSSAGLELAGALHLPDAGSPRAYALFAHCFTCTKNVKAAVNIAEALCFEGIAVLRFDFTGLGESEGDFADTDITGTSRVLKAVMTGVVGAQPYEQLARLVEYAGAAPRALRPARHHQRGLHLLPHGRVHAQPGHARRNQMNDTTDLVLTEPFAGFQF